MSLADLRICVEKPLPSEEHVIGTMDDASHTAHHFQRLQAAFQTSKLWPKNITEIKIQFANPAQYKINGQVVANPGQPGNVLLSPGVAFHRAHGAASLF